MNAKETKNIWVLFWVALVIGGAYYFDINSSTSPTNPTENNQVDNSLTNSSNVAPRQEAQQSSQTAQDNLLARQKTCAALLYGFESYEQDLNLKNTTDLNQMNWTVALSNWAVGYSPSLDACIGTYTKTLSKTPCPKNYISCIDLSYSIVNIDTKEQISLYHANLATDASRAQAYSDYKAKLSVLTNGQLH